MKVLIVDGQFLIYKSLFSHQRLTATWNDESEVISGIPFGFLKALIDMKVQYTPHFIITTWEGHPLHKKKIYKPYKQKRKPLEFDINTEIEITRALLTALKIPCVYSPGFEGEDVANYIRRKYIRDKHRGYFYTNDHDAFAMIRRNFVLINNVNGQYYKLTRKGLKNEYDLTPKQAKHIKILAGCNSDNVEGFKGIGEKFATYLIKKYGTAHRVVKYINETESKYHRLNALVAKSAHNLDLMTYATAIQTPKFVQPTGNSVACTDHLELLADLECVSLTKGANRKVLKSIQAIQAKKYKKITKKLFKGR